MKSRTLSGQTRGVSDNGRRFQPFSEPFSRTSAVGRHVIREILRGREINDKTEVSAPSDYLGQESDQLADKIMRTPDLSAQGSNEEELPPLVPLRDNPEPPAQAGSDEDLVSRIRTSLSALARSNPWIPDAVISRAETQLISLYENPFLPNWVMKFDSNDQSWGEFVVLRLYREPILAGRFHYVVEVYQEFPTTEDIWRTRLPERSAVHAATAAKNWNERIFSIISNEMEMRPLETIKEELRSLQWQHLIIAFLRAVVGAAASFYPKY